MSDFADVEQFARQHTACGGLTPNARSRPGSDGGYLLTITCACGATHDRWVTAEEARQPLSRPSRPPEPSPPPAVASAPARGWPARPLPPAPQRIELALAPARPGSRGRAVWLVLLLVLALGAAAAAYVNGIPAELTTVLGEHVPWLESPAAAPPPIVSPEARRRVALDEIVTALRRLQAEATPGAPLNDYASRVAVARLNVERLVVEAPERVRGPAREVLDLHRLAVGAWRARTIDDRDEWVRLGQDPAIDLCPPVKRAADAAAPPASASRARARGVAVGAALQPLWECAAERVAALERTPAGR